MLIFEPEALAVLRTPAAKNNSKEPKKEDSVLRPRRAIDTDLVTNTQAKL